MSIFSRHGTIRGIKGNVKTLSNHSNNAALHNKDQGRSRGTSIVHAASPAADRFTHKIHLAAMKHNRLFKKIANEVLIKFLNTRCVEHNQWNIFLDLVPISNLLRFSLSLSLTHTHSLTHSLSFSLSLSFPSLSYIHTSHLNKQKNDTLKIYQDPLYPTEASYKVGTYLFEQGDRMKNVNTAYLILEGHAKILITTTTTTTPTGSSGSRGSDHWRTLKNVKSAATGFTNRLKRSKSNLINNSTVVQAEDQVEVKTIKLLCPGDIVGEFALFDSTSNSNISSSSSRTRTAGVLVVGDDACLAVEFTLDNIKQLKVNLDDLHRPESTASRRKISVFKR